MNRFVVTTSNYLIAFSASLIMTLFSQPDWCTQLFPALLGSLGGVFFFLSFYVYQRSVRKSGASLSGAFGKMGILIPMIFSFVLWHEYPGTIQWIGISLALLSIVIVNIPRKNEKSSFHLDLIFLFLFGGIAEFFNKIFQKYATPTDDKNVFLFFIFLSAFVISLLFTLFKPKNHVRKKINFKRDFLTGIAVGIPNLFSSFFLILSLDYLKTSVVFPVYSAGSIALISIASYFIFKEKLKKVEKISILVTIFALILVNL
jgi:drug/metabolite transporter (DMT)-like permease